MPWCNGSGCAYTFSLGCLLQSRSPSFKNQRRAERVKNQISADMLLLFITVFGFFSGSRSFGNMLQSLFRLVFIVNGSPKPSSSAELKEKRECYGRSITIPFEYMTSVFNGKLYFTPTRGRRRVLIENKQSKDPRLTIRHFSAVLKDLTEKDEGTFSVSVNGDDYYTFDIIRLKVDDCASEITRFYGSPVSWEFPQETEYVEFAKLQRKDLTQVVWNRTNPKTLHGTQGTVRSGSWHIESVTQADSGYYNFRAKDNTLLRRKMLSVHGHLLHFNKDVNEELFIKYPVSFSLGQVIFIPEGTPEQETLREGGSQDPEDNWLNGRFEGRIEAFDDHLVIGPVEISDSGTFEFRDQNGYLVMTVDLEIIRVLPASVVIGVCVGIIFMLIICCCCIRKCCCKKSSSKRSESAPQSAAASATNYYADSQPAMLPYSAVPSSNVSYQPVNPRVSVEPATTSHELQAAAIGGQEGATVVGDQGAAVAAPSFSTPAPTFELKGLNFLSASPLGSGETSADVYNSGKLNFL